MIVWDNEQPYLKHLRHEIYTSYAFFITPGNTKNSENILLLYPPKSCRKTLYYNSEFCPHVISPRETKTLIIKEEGRVLAQMISWEEDWRWFKSTLLNTIGNELSRKKNDFFKSDTLSVGVAVQIIYMNEIF